MKIEIEITADEERALWKAYYSKARGEQTFQEYLVEVCRVIGLDTMIAQWK